MGFLGKRKKRYDSDFSFDASKSNIDDFHPPQLLHTDNLQTKDIKIIKNLYNDFIQTGTINVKDDDYNNITVSSVENFDDVDDNLPVIDKNNIDDFMNMLDKANSMAKSEKDFNNEFYNEEADSFLDNEDNNFIDQSDDLFNGLDDYGNKVYNDSRDFLKNYVSPVNDSNKNVNVGNNFNDNVVNDNEIIRKTPFDNVSEGKNGHFLKVELADGTITYAKYAE